MSLASPSVMNDTYGNKCSCAWRIVFLSPVSRGVLFIVDGSFEHGSYPMPMFSVCAGSVFSFSVV